MCKLKIIDFTESRDLKYSLSTFFAHKMKQLSGSVNPYTAKTFKYIHYVHKVVNDSALFTMIL